MRSAKASGTSLKPAELSVQLYLLLKISLRPLGLNLKVLTNTLSPQLPLAIPMGFPYFLKILQGTFVEIVQMFLLGPTLAPLLSHVTSHLLGHLPTYVPPLHARLLLDRERQEGELRVKGGVSCTLFHTMPVFSRARYAPTCLYYLRRLGSPSVISARAWCFIGVYAC